MRAFALTLLCAAPLAAQDHGAWVVRLGNDTMALETYDRTATGLRGEIVTRSPVTLHRIYIVTYGVDASQFELVTHNIGGAPGLPPESKGDVVARRGSQVPYLFLAAGLLEDAVRTARAGTKDSVTFIGMVAASTRTLPLTFVKAGADSVRIYLDDDGPFIATVDGAGDLTHISGALTTDKYEWDRVPALDLATLGPAFASRPIATLSPRDTLTASFNGTGITVAYGRPSVRGRKVFGGMEPWGKVWRTGANAATTLTTTGPLVVAGHTIPAGAYSLWILPTREAWILIINKQTLAPCNGPCPARRSPLWGTAYSADSDLVRVPMRLETTPGLTEQFTVTAGTYSSLTKASATLTFAWEHTRASVELRKP